MTVPFNMEFIGELSGEILAWEKKKRTLPASVELFNVRGALALKQNKEINTKESNMSCDLASTHAP